jgi:hypothetical protein
MQFKSAEELKTEKLQSIVQAVKSDIEANINKPGPTTVLNCLGRWHNLGEVEQAGEVPFAFDFLSSQDESIFEELKKLKPNVSKDRFSFQLNTEEA